MAIPRVLSIAGSDSGGGAGIQADLKAFAACGVHGMTAVTAITAQNTVGVTAVEPISPDVILAQVRAVASDIGVDAVKVGMLGTITAIEAVAQALDELRGEWADVPVVVDPVMVSESGAALLEPSAQTALAQLIVPRATVITPNLPEATVLAGEAAASREAAPCGEAAASLEAAPCGEAAASRDAAASRGTAPPRAPSTPEELARRVHALGPRYVVVTGGHRAELIDVFYDGHEVVEIPGERYPDGAAHGSGCTHSSALAAHLALGFAPLDAARAARRVAAGAVRDGLRDVGAGAGPVDALGIAGRAAARGRSGAPARLA